MAFGQNPGALFIGTLSPDDKAFVASVLKAALDDGYEKVVEPCSGGLAMSCIAADVGFKSIEASDITLFSGILGRYVEGRGIEDMEITRVEDGSRIEDPLDAMMEIKHAELVGKAGSVYGEAMLIDFEQRYDEIRAGVQQRMDEIRERIPSLKYRDMDMFDHINAVRGEKCVIVCMCPTYGGGYERFYRAIDETVSWNEPSFNVFNPPEGYADLLKAVEGTQSLLIIYEEVASGQYVGTPVYGRQAGRVGMNMYLVASDPSEVDRLLGRGMARKGASKISPMKYPIIPADYSVTRKSRVEVVKAASEHIKYYRKLWTHNFVPSQSGSGYAMLIDGYLAGIFGYVQMATTLCDTDAAFLGFGMCAPTGQRLNRLMYTLAMQLRTIRMEFDDVYVSRIRKVRTVMLTKHQESKEMRGLMKLVHKEKDKRAGFKLTYETEVQDRTYRQCLIEWAQKEETWQRKRQRA